MTIQCDECKVTKRLEPGILIGNAKHGDAAIFAYPRNWRVPDDAGLKKALCPKCVREQKRAKRGGVS